MLQNTRQWRVNQCTFCSVRISSTFLGIPLTQELKHNELTTQFCNAEKNVMEDPLNGFCIHFCLSSSSLSSKHGNTLLLNQCGGEYCQIQIEDKGSHKYCGNVRLRQRVESGLIINGKDTVHFRAHFHSGGL